MTDLDALGDDIRAQFEAVNAVRDQAYQGSRSLVSLCSRAIRAIHREDWDKANQILTIRQD